MIGITNAGGGGNILRYDVVGQMSEPAKKEGRIWIVTNVPIVQVEYSNTWGGAEVGTVAIPGTAGGANPLASNKTIYIYYKRIAGVHHKEKLTPTDGCKQVQGSAGNWVKVTAYICHENTWVQFSSSYNGELFFNGNKYTDVTGGWNSFGTRMYPWNEGWGSAAPTMEIGTNMTVYQASNPKFGTIFTGTSIDVTNYRTLKANVQYNLRGAGRNNGFWLGVTVETNDQYHPLASFMAQTDSGEKSYDGDISIDISGITGRVFVFIAVVRHTHVSEYGTNPVTFRKIWLE